MKPINKLDVEIIIDHKISVVVKLELSMKYIKLGIENVMR